MPQPYDSRIFPPRDTGGRVTEQAKEPRRHSHRNRIDGTIEVSSFLMPLNETIAIAMSGGVDSSTVAAILAREEGANVVGLTLQLWDQTRLAGKHGIPDAPKAGRCCSLDDVY